MQLFFAIAYLVSEYMRPQSMYDTLSSIPFAYLSIIGLTVTFFLSKREHYNKNPVNVYLMGYFVWYLVAYVFAVNREIAFQPMLDFTKWVVIYFLLINTINDKTRIYIFILVILALYFKLTQYTVRIWVENGFYSDPRGLNAGGGIGSGFFRNPNDFGAALTSMFGLSYYLAWFDPRRIGWIKLWWLHATNTVFFIISIVASSSRGAMLGLVAAIVAIWWKGKHRIAGIIVLLFLAVTIVALIPEDNWNRFQNMGSREDGSSQSRLALWSSAIRMLNEYPITGVGPNNFSFVNVQYYLSEFSEVQHNVFLQAGSELGYPGLMLLLGMIVAFFQNQIKTREQLKQSNQISSPLYGASHGLDVCMVGFIVNGSFITVLYYPFFWMLLILSTSLRMSVAEKDQAHVSRT